MFHASKIMDQLLNEITEYEKTKKELKELNDISEKINNQGQFKVFDPNEYGVQDDKYYIYHTNLKVYDKISMKILTKSIDKEQHNNLMYKIASYKTIIKNNKFLSIDQDLIFKDKSEIENFCDYINSILLINKLKKE